MFALLLKVLDELWQQTEITFAQPWEIPFLVPEGERDDYEIYLMERGKGTFSVGNHPFSMGKRSLIFLRTNQENRFEPISSHHDFRLVFVTFAIRGTCPAKERLDHFLSDAGALLLTLEDPSSVSTLLYSLQRAMLLHAEKDQFEMRLLLGQLVLSLQNAYVWQNNPTGKIIPGRNAATYVNQTIAYLQEHYAESLTLEILGRNVGLSPRYLSTLYSRQTGRSIWDTLALIRLDHARRLLLTTDLSITLIAADTGFGDNQYFSRCFRKAEGISPREYRKRKSEYNPTIS